MATNWNAVLANITNSADILAILRKVLGLLDGKVDLTKIDEIITDITNMQTNVDTALKNVNSALTEFDTEAQEAIQQVIAAGLMEGFATEAELLATRPTVPKKYAKAEDTDAIWFWNKPEGSPDGNYWVNTGLSEYDRAVKYTDQNVGPLKKLISSKEIDALEEAKDAMGFPFRITKNNGDVVLTARSLKLYDFEIVSDDSNNLLMLLDKMKAVFFRIDKNSDLHIPGDLKFDDGKSLVESVNNINVSSEKIYKKHAGLAYQQALISRIPARSEFTSVMTLAESNGLINRMMAGIKIPSGLFLVWHQQTKPEYNGDSSGSAFWCGFADVDSNFNITIRDKKLFIYPDTDAGLVKHPHLGRTSDNRIILVYEKSIGEPEGPPNYIKYIRYSSDEGITWTDPVLMTFTNAPPTNELKAFGTTCDIIKLKTGRLVVALYSKEGHCGCIYSDNDGASWSYSTKWIQFGNWGFEPSIALDSNDNLVMSIRPRSSIPMIAAFAKSTDNGVTWEIMHYDRVVSVTNQSHLSYDKSIGAHFESHDVNTLNRRTNYRLSISYDDCYNFPLHYIPFSENRYIGYTQLIKWVDGVYLLIMEYNDLWDGVNKNEQLGIQLFTISEIFKNVINA